jgi:hypothetical protein
MGQFAWHPEFMTERSVARDGNYVDRVVKDGFSKLRCLRYEFHETAHDITVRTDDI